MRRILHTNLLFLLLVCTPVLAGGQEVPLLQEWYHFNSTGQLVVCGPLGYLPNFDTANGGYHATTMYVHRGENPTGSGEVWYHRYNGDTISHFNWDWTGFNITQVDLDGNGVLDYFTFGRLIRGIKNGAPPETHMTAKYEWFTSQLPYTVVDLNYDGKEDVIANLNGVGGGMMFSVLVGGPDLQNLKYTLVPRRGGESFIGLLNRKADDGTFRLISLQAETWKDTNTGYSYFLWTSLILSEMKTWMQGDSLHISLRTLDSITLDTKETGYNYSSWNSGLYRAHPSSPEYLLITKYFENNDGWVMAYDVAGDRFDSVAETRTDNGRLHILNADVNGDGYNDWATRQGYDYINVHAGRPEGIDSIPFGRYRLPCTDQIDYLHAIGDVNNDGIRDMAVALVPNAGVFGCFGIFLGEKRRVVGIEEPVTGYDRRSFDMLQNYPNPVDAEGRTTIPITTEMPQQFTLELWTLNGKYIGTLHNGWTAAGVHQIDVSLKQYQLSPGMYLVRLRSAEGVRERAIIME